MAPNEGDLYDPDPRKTPGTDERQSWVVEFACPDGPPEAIVVDGKTRAEALEVRDGLGCPALRARPLSAVRLASEPWVHDGYLRVRLA
jgi:hypothetical protein